jgi:type VI secretion system secreted protein Hcp
MFLKLSGVRGESQNPRHYGEIEISSFSWGGKYQHSSGGPGKATISDLTFTKMRDKTSGVLMVASHSGQHFTEAVLTIEQLSEWGSMMRSIVFELKSILLDSVSGDGETDTITLSFADLKMMRS